MATLGGYSAAPGSAAAAASPHPAVAAAAARAREVPAGVHPAVAAAAARGAGPPLTPGGPPRAPMAPDGGQPTEFAHHGWKFEGATRRMWATDAIDELGKERGLCQVPDMYHGDARFRAFDTVSGFGVELTASEALRCCSWRPPPAVHLQPHRSEVIAGGAAAALAADIKEGAAGSLLPSVQCQFATRWKPATANPDVKELEVTSDWTVCTPYWGAIYNTKDSAGEELPECVAREETCQDPTMDELPWELLRRRDPINWYQDVLFWEDELGDNGLCRTSVRVRVMPTFWFALLLCEMRVDNVMFREVATRFFCRFDSDTLVREWTWKEATYEALKQRGISLGPDNPVISQESVGTSLLGEEDIKRQLRYKIKIGGKSAAPAAA